MATRAEQVVTKFFLTWPLAGSFLQLPHWLSLVQEALQEWESSIELEREKDIKDFFVKKTITSLIGTDGNTYWSLTQSGF